MNEQELNSQPQAPVVPPTQAGQMYIPTQPSKWPTVIGIIAIVFGVLGALGGIWGAITSIFMDKMMFMTPPGQRDHIVDSMREMSGLTIVGGLLSMFAAVLLFVAGVGLVKCRPWSGKLCNTWAFLKIVVLIFSTYVGYMTQQAMMEAMIQNNPNMAANPGMMIGASIGVFIGLVWGLALPVFMLIWFSRAKVKQEVATWR